jgi:glycosyltransferase involved in cell wall biosynthesis
MKILIVSSEPGSPRGFGSGKFVRTLCRALVESGFETLLLTSFESDRLSGIPQVRRKIPRKLLFDYVNPLAQWELEKVSERFHPDVVHFNNVYGISSALISRAARDFPTVVTVHDYWPFCYFSTMMKRGQVCSMDCRNCAPPMTTVSRRIRHAQLRESILVGPSMYMAQRLKDAGFPRVMHIPYGISIPPEPAPENARILFIGRLTHVKGIEDLVDVAARLTLPLHVFGDGPLATKVARRCRSYPHITFHGFSTDIDFHLRGGGSLVIPSTWPENQPFVALEALAHGLPIIASRIGGLPELVEAGKNGYLFEPGNRDELAELLKALAENRDIRREFTDASREMAKGFSVEKMVSSYESLYHNITPR